MNFGINASLDTSQAAIYLQVAEKVRNNILKGIYAPGTRLPSIRKLSKKMRVSTNTVQRAIYVIQRERVIKKRSSQGFFVISDLDVLTKLKQNFAARILNEFLYFMHQMGYADKTIFELVTSFQG